MLSLRIYTAQHSTVTTTLRSRTAIHRHHVTDDSIPPYSIPRAEDRSSRCSETSVPICKSKRSNSSGNHHGHPVAERDYFVFAKPGSGGVV
jgi:hypothetical protein